MISAIQQINILLKKYTIEYTFIISNKYSLKQERKKQHSHK